MRGTKLKQLLFASLVITTLSLNIQGCNFSIGNLNAPTPTARAIFIPPTPAKSGDSTAANPAVVAPARSTDCTNQLIFIKDLSIPDGSTVPPGSVLDKRWEVKNSGTCSWDERYHLRLVAGPDLNAASEQSLYPARSGSQVVIRVQFSAPTADGSYRSAWQAFGPDDQSFGDPFFIDFKVGSP
jgi:hypothetical protein